VSWKLSKIFLFGVTPLSWVQATQFEDMHSYRHWRDLVIWPKITKAALEGGVEQHKKSRDKQPVHNQADASWGKKIII